MSTLSMRRWRRQTSENPVKRHPDRKQPSIASRGTVEFESDRLCVPKTLSGLVERRIG